MIKINGNGDIEEIGGTLLDIATDSATIVSTCIAFMSDRGIEGIGEFIEAVIETAYYSIEKDDDKEEFIDGISEAVSEIVNDRRGYNRGLGIIKAPPSGTLPS